MGGRRRQREGGRQHLRLVSYPRIIQEQNGELGEVMDMDEVEIVYASSTE